MRQGYWYISDASQKAQEKFFAKAKQYGGVGEDGASSIIFGSHDKSVCVGGQVFRTGNLIGGGQGTKLESAQVAGLVYGLNHALYAPAFDKVQYIADTRTSLILLGAKVNTRGFFLEACARAKRIHTFIWEEGGVDPRTRDRNDISALSLVYKDLAVTLTVESDSGNTSGIRRVSSRTVRLNPNGKVSFNGNSSLCVFDSFLIAALITGWAEKKIEV